MPLPLLIAAGALAVRGGMVAATLAPLVKPAIGIAKRFVQKAAARPGIGSKVTKGPLKLGKQTILGPKPSVAMQVVKVAGAAVGAGGVGLVTVASHREGRVQRSPATKPSPSPSRSSKAPSSTSTDRKLCCPQGTKRKVCFKRDVDPVAESKRKAKARKAKARAIKRGRKSARKPKKKARK